MTIHVIFAKAGKIIAIEEGWDVSYFDCIGATLLKIVEVRRMGPRILKEIMEGKR